MHRMLPLIGKQVVAQRASQDVFVFFFSVLIFIYWGGGAGAGATIVEG